MDDLPFIRDTRHGATLAVRVQPRASRTATAGIFGTGEERALKVALAAPPVDGKANDALLRFLADLLGLPLRSLSLLGGAHSRTKIVCIAHRTAAEIASLLTRAV